MRKLPAGRLVLNVRQYGPQRKRWHEERQKGIGASEIAAVIAGGALHPYLTPLDVWLSKVGPVGTETFPSEAAEWGATLEAVVARKVFTRHRHEIGWVAPAPGLLAHDEYPWMLATPDRLLVHQRSDEVLGLLEIKTVGRYAYDMWDKGFPPDHIQLQVQQQLAVCGLPFAYVAVLVGGQMMPEPVRIERDERVIAAIATEGDSWWRKHVIGNVRPEPTYVPGRSLGDYWTADPHASAAVLDERASEVVERYVKARNASRDAAAEQERLGFEVAEVMRDATQLLDEGGRVVATFKEQVARRFDVRAARSASPELVDEYMRETTSRVLRVKGLDG